MAAGVLVLVRGGVYGTGRAMSAGFEEPQNSTGWFRLRRHADDRQDRRKILGAVVSREVKNLALKNGFFVIEQSGNTMVIDVSNKFSLPVQRIR
jgi:hypothetical protein